jgi:hypothetical protein
MATLSISPTNINKGDGVIVDGDDFLPSTTVTLEYTKPGLATFREIVSTDGSGSFSTTDEVDFAVATLTSTGTNVANNDTVTIGAVTYTFKTTLTPAANEVLIGASAAASLQNLKDAINQTGVSGTQYAAATTLHPTVRASTITATTLFLVAKTGGTGGNSLASTEASTQLSFGGGTFSGGAAATGATDAKFFAEAAGKWILTATDGTNSATSSFVVWN